MSENKRVLPPEGDDPDLPELTDEFLDVADLRLGDRLVRPASGYLGRKALCSAAPGA